MKCRALLSFFILSLALFMHADDVRMLRDIADSDADAEANFLTVSNGLLFFVANDGVTGHELWVSDSTEAGVYTQTYYALDRAGNKYERLTRTVIVIEPVEGEGEGEGEPVPSVYDDTDAIITQGDFFRGVVLLDPEDTDIGEDGIHDYLAVALFIQAVCDGADAELGDAARAAFNANSTAVVLEPAFAQLSQTVDAFDVYMSLSTAMQVAITDKSMVELAGTYVLALGEEESFPAAGNPDGDGVTSGEESANLLSLSLGYQAYTLAALNPNDIGFGPGIAKVKGRTTPDLPHPIPRQWND